MHHQRTRRTSRLQFNRSITNVASPNSALVPPCHRVPAPGHNWQAEALRGGKTP
jgi:hypothetical protein